MSEAIRDFNDAQRWRWFAAHASIYRNYRESVYLEAGDKAYRGKTLEEAVDNARFGEEKTDHAE